MPPLPALRPLEVATGLALGWRSGPRRRLADEPAATTAAVLDELLLDAVRRSPCVVAFSGGRDSSSMLAAAADVARRHGLPLPVPVTMRYPDHPRTHEDEWQERVVRHLGLTEWIKVPMRDELDVAGPLATSLLERHGLYWPSNGTSIAAVAEHARGGALITGNGGDEILSAWRYRRLVQIRRGRAVPRRGELKHVAVTYLPHAARRALWTSRHGLPIPWLTEEGRREHARYVGTVFAEWRRSWAEQVEYVVNSRARELSGALFACLAGERDALLVEPFFDPRFAAALVAEAPADGFAGRSVALQHLFGHLLPPETIERSTKATFTEVFFGPHARAHARAWDGTGLPPGLVDPDALRAVWARERPDMRSFTPLQATLLAAAAQPPRVAASMDATTS